ncbi:MAG: hypothetical protein CENE_00383 [Candidatus Celerinatantimonas neptuna]|nr:MAG: hypothetical protein CENE_00383 [Candidatus Celerinatantimonas neptuna]
MKTLNLSLKQIYAIQTYPMANVFSPKSDLLFDQKGFFIKTYVI